MKKFKIIHERELCIGCGACVSSCPDYWSMGDDEKSELKGAKNTGDKFELDLEEIECNIEAAKGCPVNCIHILRAGKKVI